MEQMEKNLLKTVADISGFMPGSAFSLRKNGAGVERHSTEHVKILAKTDKPGIDIIVDANTVGESIHIPVILTEAFRIWYITISISERVRMWRL